MKKKILVITTFAFVFAAVFISCNSSSEKVTKAEENVEKAKEDLITAKAEYQQEIEDYKIIAANKTAANEQNFTEFNARIEKEKDVVKADYKKKMAELEQKNTDMKKRMADYKEDGKENWEIFKINFNRDMDQLGKSIRDLTGIDED
ncbi:MAG: hypothetical protein JXR58_03000 [Bacteroidales bacterium]|nr:hypothetical protein [Bacteroidales bacterium]